MKVRPVYTSKNFKAAIFDLDGVVVDTVPLHFAAWKKMFEEHGETFTMQDYKLKVDGIPRMDGGRAILKNLSHEELLQATDQKQKYFLDLLNQKKIPVFDSTLTLIRALKEKGVRLAVISSSRNASFILEKTGVFTLLDVVINGNEIPKGKPDPHIFLEAASQLKIHPLHCIVFEDAVLGIKAAKRAEMACVGIDRHGDPGRLSEANLVVSDLIEVNYELLANLLHAVA